MVLNSHTPYDDPSDDEEEWEFLNSGDTTPTDLQLEVAEEPPAVAATPSADAAAEAGRKDDVKSNEMMEHRPNENRQDESETNSGASIAVRNNDVASSVQTLVEVDQPLEEDTPSIASGDSEEDSAASPPPQEQERNPLRNTWNLLENTFQNIDNQHQLRRRTSNSVKQINQSMQNIFSNITDETQRVRDEVDVHARNASTHVSHAASSIKESICRANAEHKLSEKVATVAVIGGATLLALGNPRAGVTALAVAGASLAVGEVVSSSDYEESDRNREEYGLPEGVHID